MIEDGKAALQRDRAPSAAAGPGGPGGSVTPERLEASIRLSRPRGRGLLFWSRALPTVGMAAAAGLFLTTGTEEPLWRQAIPFGLFSVVMGLSWILALRARRVYTRHREALEAVQARQWERAAEALLRLLSRPVDSTELRQGALVALAHVAGQLGAHESAAALCDEVLGVTPGRGAAAASPPDRRGRQAALVEKALALLGAERLTDANGLIDGFRTMEFREPMATMAALAGLYRSIRTRDFAGAAESADDLAPRARANLHGQAAYVYGLLALAFEQTGKTERAQAFYDCATRLMSPAELSRRFEELAGLERALVPARSPL